MIFQTSRSQTKASLTILTSDKIGVEPKMLTRKKEDHYISIKVSIHKGDITIKYVHSQQLSTKIY